MANQNIVLGYKVGRKAIQAGDEVSVNERGNLVKYDGKSKCLAMASSRLSARSVVYLYHHKIQISYPLIQKERPSRKMLETNKIKFDPRLLCKKSL